MKSRLPRIKPVIREVVPEMTVFEHSCVVSWKISFGRFDWWSKATVIAAAKII